MAKLNRKDGGQPIRDAMEEADLSGPELAGATRKVDPEGRGVSPATVGFMTGEGRSARERFMLRTAWLVAAALRKPLQDLFVMPPSSTSTKER
jgi:hypothetical protein